MNNSATLIAGKISSSDPLIPLTLKILLDDTIVYETAHVTESMQFSFTVSDDEGDHELQFVMSGKNQEHTVIDDQGNITKDALLTISDVCFDEIDITQILNEQAVYTHDFNGTKSQTQDKFFGGMGCNGSVSLKFYTPLYIFLLENI